MNSDALERATKRLKDLLLEKASGSWKRARRSPTSPGTRPCTRQTLHGRRALQAVPKHAGLTCRL